MTLKNGKVHSWPYYFASHSTSSYIVSSDVRNSSALLSIQSPSSQAISTMTDAHNPAIVEPPYHEIFTERLKLRTLRVSDAAALMPIITSKEVMQWTVSASNIELPTTAADLV